MTGNRCHDPSIRNCTNPSTPNVPIPSETKNHPRFQLITYRHRIHLNLLFLRSHYTFTLRLRMIVVVVVVRIYLQQQPLHPFLIHLFLLQNILRLFLDSRRCYSTADENSQSDF